MSTWSDWRAAPEAQFAVIGDPISHSRSPLMLTAAFRAVGLDLKYVALRVPLSEFEEAMIHLDEQDYTGVNVTVPLKELAFEKTMGGDPRMGAVNTVRFEDNSAINTDAPGFLRTLQDLGIGRCRVLVLGAGGSARSVCVALSDAGYEVTVYNRTQSRAEQLAEHSRCPVTVLSSPDPEGCGLIVNATSAGLHGISPTVEWANASKGALAYDLMYGPAPTPFMNLAEEFGLKGVDGKQLLVAQGALSFEWWTGLSAPREAMMQAVS